MESVTSVIFLNIFFKNVTPVRKILVYTNIINGIICKINIKTKLNFYIQKL